MHLHPPMLTHFLLFTGLKASLDPLHVVLLPDATVAGPATSNLLVVADFAVFTLLKNFSQI